MKPCYNEITHNRHSIIINLGAMTLLCNIENHNIEVCDNEVEVSYIPVPWIVYVSCSRPKVETQQGSNPAPLHYDALNLAVLKSGKYICHDYTIISAGSSNLISFCIHSLLIWLRNFLRSRVILRLSIVNRAPSTPPIIPITAVGMNINRFTSTPESIWKYNVKMHL